MSDERKIEEPGVQDEIVSTKNEPADETAEDILAGAEDTAAPQEEPESAPMPDEEENTASEPDLDETGSDGTADAEKLETPDTAEGPENPGDASFPVDVSPADDTLADLDEPVEDESGEDLPNYAAGADEPEDDAEPEPEPERYGTVPHFLSREEYETFGDDPEPLPHGFEVIDGGVGNPQPAAAPEPEDAPDADDLEEAPVPHGEPAPEQPVDAGPSKSEAFARAATEAASTVNRAAKETASNVNQFISQGMGAVREMNAARRAHAEAREMLEDLEDRIGKQTKEVAYRRDVIARYPEIIAEQTGRKSSAKAAIEAAKAMEASIADQLSALKRQLEDMKASDETAEKRLKAALESAENKEESARESAARLKRRLSDAQRGVEKAQENRKAAIETAQHAIETANARLNTLREEYAEIQRNPSANSAAYSVRGEQLAGEIADATEELRRAKDNLPRVTADAERTIAAAKDAVKEAERPIAEAKEAFRTITDGTAGARDALEDARKAAAERQRSLKATIADQERKLKEEQQAQKEANDEIADADRRITDAAKIHDNPDVTDRIAAALAADTAERDELLQQVQTLAEAEANVRERTRSSRMRFIGAIAAVLAVVVVILVIWFSFT